MTLLIGMHKPSQVGHVIQRRIDYLGASMEHSCLFKVL